uniref:Uncharacterized protein n=1 Tax=Anopheles melas TaxID=34690 RepID=A0A182TIA3_9DIPT
MSKCKCDRGIVLVSSNAPQCKQDSSGRHVQVHSTFASCPWPFGLPRTSASLGLGPAAALPCLRRYLLLNRSSYRFRASSGFSQNAIAPFRFAPCSDCSSSLSCSSSLLSASTASASAFRAPLATFTWRDSLSAIASNESSYSSSSSEVAHLLDVAFVVQQLGQRARLPRHALALLDDALHLVVHHHVELVAIVDVQPVDAGAQVKLVERIGRYMRLIAAGGRDTARSARRMVLLEQHADSLLHVVVRTHDLAHLLHCQIRQQLHDVAHVLLDPLLLLG